jgi:ketosteroid isomerase-like protein
MSRENVQALRAVYEEWGKGNFRAGADIYDRLVVMIPGGDPTDTNYYLGLEGIRKYSLELLSAWTNYTMSADEFIEVDNSVVVAVHQRGVGRESGIPGEMRFYAVWTFRGRNAVRLETFGDRAQALEAVGLRE